MANEAQPTDGLVLIVLRIRDQERREQAVYHLENLETERPLPSIYEFNIGDWNEGEWNEEVEWFTDLLEGTGDRIIVWRFSGNSYVRFTIGEGS